MVREVYQVSLSCDESSVTFGCHWESVTVGKEV